MGRFCAQQETDAVGEDLQLAEDFLAAHFMRARDPAQVAQKLLVETTELIANRLDERLHVGDCVD